EAHLDACQHCGARVRAALAGSPDEVLPVISMPSEQVAIMDAALADAWRERRDAIAAAEAHEPARPLAADATSPLSPDAIASTDADTIAPPARTRKRSWGRRLVPVLAFCVLGALAGTSIWLGNDDIATTSRGGGDAATESAESTAE